jgi:hypothetical protein
VALTPTPTTQVKTGLTSGIVGRKTPTAAATSVTVRPSLITASTARYRCSAKLISLIRECQGSTGTGVNHQPEPRKASTGTGRSSIKRSHTRLSGAGGARTHDQRIMRPLALSAMPSRLVSVPFASVMRRIHSCSQALADHELTIDQDSARWLARSTGYVEPQVADQHRPRELSDSEHTIRCEHRGDDGQVKVKRKPVLFLPQTGLRS